MQAMGDSDTVVAQMGYSPAGYPSTGYADVGSAGGVASEAAPAGETLTVTEGSEAVELNNAGGYDSSVNGTVVENGDAGLDSVAGAVVEQQYVDGLVLSAEEERLWNTVKANSSDFNAWTALIEETEKLAESNILKIRKVYDSFLAEFPLCYGYWKKYADHEAQLGSIDKVVEVYERAVLGVTYSVDIWLHYCIFAISTYGGDPDTIRRFFERGLAYVGTDYLSFSLWDKYIEYEYLQQEWVRLAMIYTRILENPNQQLDRYFNRVKAMMTVYGNDDSFKDLAGSRPLSELRTPEEAAAVVVAAAESGNQENGEEVASDSAEETHKPVSGLTEAEELEKYIGVREEMYKKAKEFDSKIIGFETAIRRPYFHVRPLSVAELENWHNYLDFIEREGDLNKVVNLYERCLIACASYHDYWIRYVLCMEASERLDLANNALARATQVFVKRQPEIHLFAARFKEQNGDIPGARAAYQLVHSEITPGLLEGIIKHANMEHRLGNLDDGFSLYEQAIAIEKGKEHSQTLPMLFAQYSRFTHLVCGNPEKAREILVDAIEHVQVSKPLLEALIHFESTQARPKQIDFLDSLVVKFIEPNSEHLNVSLGEREELSSIFLEFLNLFGDVQSIKKAADRHAKLFLPHRSSPELKKRHAEDYLTSDKTKLARSYGVAPSQAQSMVGAYPNVQNQWPAGYGTQPQAWPPASQTPGQQWTPGGYTQPASYGATAYPGYASGTPQSTTAYAGYPPTYTATAQTYPPQSYAQATAATTPQVPAQQPASATQAYYGNYY